MKNKKLRNFKINKQAQILLAFFGIFLILLPGFSIAEQSSSATVNLPEETETFNECPNPEKCNLAKPASISKEEINESNKVSGETDIVEQMFFTLRLLWTLYGIVKGEEYEKELAAAVRWLALEGSLESYNILNSVYYENKDIEALGIQERKIPFEELPEDYFFREGAVYITAMGFIEVKDNRIEEKMIEKLKDKNSLSVHKAAFFVLKESEPSDSDTLKWLINKLGEGFDAFSALLKSDLSDPEIQNLIAEKLENEDPFTQEQALVLLEESETSDPKIHKKIEKKLKSENFSMQLKALFALKEVTNLFDSEILNSIAKQLEDEEIHIQVLAFLALGQHLKDPLDPKIQEKIEKKLADENPPIVQIAALLALGKINSFDLKKNQEKIESKLQEWPFYSIIESIALTAFHQISLMNPNIFRPGIGDSNELEIIITPKRNDMARFVLKAIFSEPKTQSSIAEKLEDRNPLIRIISLLILGEARFFGPEIQQKIENKLKDKNSVVRKTAELVLKKISNH